MAWILALLGSLIGIAGLLIFKNWEQRRGGLPGAAIRATADAKVVVISTQLKQFPQTLHVSFRVLLKHVIFYVSAAMLRVVQFTERKLIRVINLVRGKGDITTKKGSASFFLQNVATYKDAQSTPELQ